MKFYLNNLTIFYWKNNPRTQKCEQILRVGSAMALAFWFPVVATKRFFGGIWSENSDLLEINTVLYEKEDYSASFYLRRSPPVVNWPALSCTTQVPSSNYLPSKSWMRRNEKKTQAIYCEMINYHLENNSRKHPPWVRTFNPYCLCVGISIRRPSVHWVAGQWWAFSRSFLCLGVLMEVGSGYAS